MSAFAYLNREAPVVDGVVVVLEVLLRHRQIAIDPMGKMTGALSGIMSKAETWAWRSPEDKAWYLVVTGEEKAHG